MQIDKFLQDRFGMFIHWGAYSASGRSEWLRSHDKVSVEDYQKYVDNFNPREGCIKEWARLAREAGMKYAVITAKHHDGFCLFKSDYTDYSAYNTIGRDLIAEYTEAFRTEGIQVGLYYSLIDWKHKDFPHYGDLQHPLREDVNEKDKERNRNLKTYIEYMHNQVRELLTNYGKIDIIWFDFSYNNPKDSGHPAMKGETWEATKLVNMIRKLQPDIIFNNRLGSNSGMMEANPEFYAGDFTSPEQIVPPKGMLNAHSETIAWEACMTMTSSWAYTRNPDANKSTKTLIRALIDCVSKNGNLLLNVGPTANGDIPEASAKGLEEIGKWMKVNGQSIYGCKASDLPKPDWGRFTEKKGKLYAHIFERGVGPIPLIGLEGKVKSAKLLSDGALLPLERPWNVDKFPNDAFINLPWFDYLPDENSTVIELVLAEDAL